MPAGGGGMGFTGGVGRGAADPVRRRGGALHPLKIEGRHTKVKRGKKDRPKHNRGFNVYGASGGKGSSMQSKRRGKKPFSPAKARNIG